MKKVTCFLVLLAFMAAVSCSKSGIDPDEPVNGPSGSDEPAVEGLYILNSGKMGNNDATLAYYDTKANVLSADIFKKSNGKKLGDTGNDMLIYGSKIYIAMTGSAVVFVTDLQGYLLKEITVQGDVANLSPRHLATVDGKVYVSYMEGYVGAIDTASFNVKTVKVGPMPEGMAYANKKVYVANSDGYNWPYGKTISVIDPSSFTVTKTLECANNPQTFHVASENKVYLITWGDYGEVPAQLHKINTATDAITTIDGIVPTNMAIGKDGVAYILSTVYDDNWNAATSYDVFDTTKDKLVGEFVPEADVPNGYCLFADKFTGDVYIGASDYISNGDVYIVSSDGQVVGKFDTGALNPITICPVN